MIYIIVGILVAALLAVIAALLMDPEGCEIIDSSTLAEVSAVPMDQRGKANKCYGCFWRRQAHCDCLDGCLFVAADSIAIALGDQHIMDTFAEAFPDTQFVRDEAGNLRMKPCE